MTFTKKLIGFSLVSILILVIANALFPELIVFGNFVTDPILAILSTGTLVGIIVVCADLVIDDFHIKLSKNSQLITNYLINSLALYILARSVLSKMIGFGIVGFWIAFVIGVFTTGAQYFLLRILQNSKAN